MICITPIQWNESIWIFGIVRMENVLYLGFAERYHAHTHTHTYCCCNDIEVSLLKRRGKRKKKWETENDVYVSHS